MYFYGRTNINICSGVGERVEKDDNWLLIRLSFLLSGCLAVPEVITLIQILREICLSKHKMAYMK